MSLRLIEFKFMTSESSTWHSEKVSRFNVIKSWHLYCFLLSSVSSFLLHGRLTSIILTDCVLVQVMLVMSSRRKAAKSSQSKVEDTQLEFSESMRRTQEAVARQGCLSRWCNHRESHDKYAVDVLATEIDSLKRTVKEVSSHTLLTLNIRNEMFSLYWCQHEQGLSAGIKAGRISWAIE